MNAEPETIGAEKLDVEDALRLLIDYAEWQIVDGGEHLPTLPSAVAAAKKVLAAACRPAAPAPRVDREVVEAATALQGARAVYRADPTRDALLAVTTASNRLDAALANAQAPAPEATATSASVGWRTVPVEPTEAMLKAAFVAMNETPSGEWKRMKAEGVTPRRLFDVKMAPRYRAMLSAAPEPPAGDGWQDIATAPRDRKIDLLFPYPRGRTIDCQWDDMLGWSWRVPVWDGERLLPEADWDFSNYPNMQPTHWREPPPPPAQGERK